ncbi:MAG: right-handed parallel beta-helix repeat-containing protein, partial [Phycisphaerae bacterium]
MYNANKSFSIMSLVICFAVFFLTIFTSPATAVDLPFNPNDYSFLVYNPGGTNIEQAMYNLGIPYDPRDSTHPVTATDLASHDILIIGSTSGGNTNGLHSNDLLAGITGRVILTGHDVDWHSTNDSKLYVRQAAEKFLINAINYVLHGGSTGMLIFADIQNPDLFPYIPPTWGISSQYISPWGDNVTNFTSEALASGVYDNLDPCDMSDWNGTYHDKFTITQGSPFVPFELGGVNNGDTITIAQTAICPSPFTLAKADNAPADGVKPNDRLTYTIYYRYPDTNPNYTTSISNIIITDYLPAEVLHTDVAPSGNGDYNSTTHKVTWTIGTLSPGNSGSVTVTVTVGNTTPSAGHLTNTAKIRADDVNEISAVRQTPYYYMVHNVNQNRWYHTIQSAIINLTTVNGDTLVAYPGTYTEAVDFGSKVLTLRSTNPNDPLIVAQTIIEGNGSDTVTFTNNNSTLNGFTITSADDDDGIHCTGSVCDPNIKNCIIRDNSYGINCDNSSAPTIANCIIKDNAVGIQCGATGQVKIINNLIVNNGTEDYGCGIILNNIAAGTVIRNNTICGNYRGIYLYYYGEPNISNCIIRGNTSDMDYADIPFDTVN